MATGVLTELLRSAESGATDGALLTAFVERHDPVAFAELVNRHGPMVLGVCLRVLRHRQDAEDAFQAAFLVLATKAATVSPRDTVGNWLYGVALQTAVRVRAVNMKRREKETPVAAIPEGACIPEPGWDDVAAVLDEELGRLPDHYRAVIVLSDVEGRSRKDVADHLNCPEGSVASRLSRARAMLARRLSRRGVTLTAGAIALLLGNNATAADVSAALARTTVEAATSVAAGAAVAGGISPAVSALTNGVLKAMLVTKLKTVAFAALVLALVGFGGVVGLGAIDGSRRGQAPPSTEEPVKPSAPLEGVWGLSLPAGFQSDIRLASVAAGEYEFRGPPNSVFAGRYRHEGDRLTLAKKDPLDRDLTFVWKLTGSDSAELAEEPPVGLTGASYLGASLKREPPKHRRPERTPIPKDERKPLTVKELTGTWSGEAENIGGIRKLTAALDFDIARGRGQGVRCQFRFETEEAGAAGLGLDVEMIEDAATGRVNLRLENGRVVLGHLARGETGAIVLAMLPEIENRNRPGEKLYRRFEGLVLRRQEELKGQADDMKALQGTWRELLFEQDGLRMQGDELANVNVVVVGNTIEFGSSGLFSFTLVPSQTPKAILFSKDKEAYRGIYHLSGDDLKICYVPASESKLPTDFTVPKGSEHRFIILKRIADRTEGWSEPVNRLQARLVLVEEQNRDVRWLVPYLELRSGDGRVQVRCATRHAKFTLVEADGKTLRDGWLFPRSGPHLDPGTLVVPVRSSLRAWMGCTNWGVPGNAAAVIATDSGAWSLGAKDNGKVFLRLTLSGDKVEDDREPIPTWHGTIELSVPVTWGGARVEQPPAAPPNQAPEADLSKFPKLTGKVVDSLGTSRQAGTPPKTGDGFQLDFAGVAKLKSLPFDRVKESHLPIPGQHLAVASLEVDTNGSLESVRLTSRDRDTTLRVDVVPKPTLGPRRVLVWAVTEYRGAVEHVALIDCEADGAFPEMKELADAKDDLKGTWVVTDDGGKNPPGVKTVGTTWTFKGGVLTRSDSKAEKDRAARSYRVDRTTAPARITVQHLTLLESTPIALAGPEQHGVYEVSGDTLRLYLDPLADAKTAPKTFPKGGGVLTLKRAPKE